MPGVSTTPEIIFGCASFGDPNHPQAKFNSAENTLPLLDLLRSRGVTYLDTARAYPVGAPGTSEALLGKLDVGKWATVDTKVVSWKPGTHNAEGIAKSIPASLEALKMPKVNVMYLHAPDRSTPFEITLRAMDKAYKEGKFERFGVSNYTAEEVEEMVAICEKEGLIKPTVYQGRYNAIIRSGEEGLFPTLRKHGISFYAYSPSAAGLFSGKVSRESTGVAGSRWDSATPLGKVYQEDYFKDKLFEASGRLQKVAKDANLTGHAVALRWILHHSALGAAYGDKVIIGSSSIAQCKENLDILAEGPLDDELVKSLDEVWEMAKDYAPAYHR